MKHSLLLVLALIFIIICIICLNLMNIQNQNKEVSKENSVYEKYLDKEVFGTEVATVISRAVDQNEKNKIAKDEKGYYIENQENSIKIDLKMVTIDKTFPMEVIYDSKISNFVQNFNTIKFKCTNIEYHKKTGKVSKLVFEELE